MYDMIMSIYGKTPTVSQVLPIYTENENKRLAFHHSPDNKAIVLISQLCLSHLSMDSRKNTMSEAETNDSGKKEICTKRTHLGPPIRCYPSPRLSLVN